MKNNNLRLIALLAAGTLCITGCGSNNNDNSSPASEENSMTQEEEMQIANEEIAKAVQATTAKVDNADLIGFKGNAKLSVDAKVDFSDLLPLISNENADEVQAICDLLKAGVNADANADIILNADITSSKLYAAEFNRYQEDDNYFLSEYLTNLSKIAENDKTEAYAKIDVNVSEDLFKAITLINQTGSKYRIEAGYWYNVNEMCSDTIAYIDDVKNTEEINKTSSEGTYQTLANIYGAIFGIKDSVSAEQPSLPEELPEGAASYLELLQSYAKGEITNAQLVDQVVTAIKKNVGEDAAAQIDALFTANAKAYITSILDTVISSNWGSIIKLGVDAANGETTYSYTFDAKALLTVVDNILVTALTNSSNYPSESLPLMVAAYIPTIRAVINAVMPTALNVTESISIKGGIVTKVAEKVVANGSVDLAFIDTINQIANPDYVAQFAGKKVTYNVTENAELGFELAKTAFEIPASPEMVELPD